MSLQKKCFTASAITHGLLLLIVFVGSAFIPQKPQIKGPEFEIFSLPPDFELIPDDQPPTGGSRDAAGGPKIKPQADIPQPVTPPPQPKVEAPKVEVPIAKPPEPKPEPIKQPDLPKPKSDPENFDFTKAKKIEPKKIEPKKKEPTEFQQMLSKAKPMKIPVDSKSSTQPDTNGKERQLAAAQSAALAEMNRDLQGRLSSGPAKGKGNVDDFFGPGGGKFASASYKQYLASEYQKAWIAPAKSSVQTGVLVTVVIDGRGVVLSAKIVTPSGNREYDSAADAVLRRVRRFEKAPLGEAPVTYTFEIKPSDL